MVALGSVAAVLLFLVPVAVLLLAFSHRGARPGVLSLAIPLAVALDLLLVLTLALVVRLETAVLATRPLWAAAGLAIWIRRPPRWPTRLTARATAGVLAASLVATALSASLSRPYAIWDRPWHVPLVASLRGQQLPFENVYQPGVTLHYHFAGDVLAASLQTLSFLVLHASHALSLAHDLLFALAGASMGLLFLDLGLRGAAARALAAALVLLAGPFTLSLSTAAAAPSGYSILNLLTLSFRPHVSLAVLLLLGVFAALWSCAARPGSPHTRRAGLCTLVSTSAALAITDETSLGLVGLALGGVWLIRPSILHPRRSVGLAVLLALLCAFVFPNLLFGAALAPDAPRLPVRLVPWRSPGFNHPPLSLSALAGLRALAADAGPSALLLLGAAALTLRDRRPGPRAVLLVLAAVFALACLGLTRIDIGGSALESHRFFTAALVLCPLAAIAGYARSSPPGGPLARARMFVARALVVIGALLAASSTVDWLVRVAPSQCEHHRGLYTREDFYATDCRARAGARFGSVPEPTYLDRSVWYLYAGCNPVFAPGERHTGWHLSVKGPLLDGAALAALQRMVAPDRDLAVVCPAAATGARGPCHEPSDCRPAGSGAVRCSLPAALRKAPATTPTR